MNNSHANTRLADLTIIAVLSALAFGTRIYGLGHWAVSGDEFATIDFAADRYMSIINPAYYALVLASFKLLGVSEFAARLPATLLGAVSVPIFFATWRNIIGRNAAFIGGLIIIFSSWHLWWSQFSRFYTGAFLFGSLSYYWFYQALLRDDLRRLAGALLAAIVGFLFHATVAMVPIACAVYALVVLSSRGASRIGLSRRVARTYLALCILVAVVTLPILLGIWQARESAGKTWGDAPLEMALQIVHRIQLPIAAAALFGLSVLVRRNVWLGIYFLVGTALPAGFVLTAAAVMNSRSVYLFYTMPLYVALAAVMCEEVRGALANRHRIASHVLTAFLLLMLSPAFFSHYSGRSSLDVRDAVAYIDQALNPNDVVVSFSTDFYYYGRQKFPITRMVHPLSSRDWQTKMEGMVAKHERVWVIVQRWRKPLSQDLEVWLTNNAQLVWRRYEKRYDYSVKGYEIYRLDSRARH